MYRSASLGPLDFLSGHAIPTRVRRCGRPAHRCLCEFAEEVQKAAFFVLARIIHSGSNKEASDCVIMCYEHDTSDGTRGLIMSVHTVSDLSCDFSPKKTIEFEVSDAPISSDAGLLLIRQFDQKIRLTEQVADALQDRRTPALARQSIFSMVR